MSRLTPEQAAEYMLERVLTTVVWSLAESQNNGETLNQAVMRLNAALFSEYGLDNATLLALAAKKALGELEKAP